MPAKITLALVGCGWISESHVNGYKDLWNRGCREFEVTAVCDLNPAAAKVRADQIAAYQGSAPKIFTDIAALTAAKIADAADVCVPHCFHHSTAIPLLEGGMHVLCEKPIGITIRATKAIIAAAKRAGKVLATAENVRRDLAARAGAWAMSEAKLIGEPIAASVVSFAHGPLNISDPKFQWRAVKNLTGGGMIMDSGAHFTDMVLLMFGDVKSVSCTMRTLDDREIPKAPVVGKAKVDVEDFWHADIRFTSGMQVSWSFSNAFHGKVQRGATYYGRNGTMTDLGWPFHPFQGGASLVTSTSKEMSRAEIEAAYQASLDEATKKRLFPYGATDGFAIEVWDFVNAIATGRAPEMDGQAGLISKTLCECCYESATIGRPVTFAEVLDGTVDAYQRPIDEFWKLMPAAASAAR
ncbi:MAG: Gfo/Idh/MocA family oxidoreductase [Planctomycetes bacterium]|nr:Gfo/Idh/MocA family oxidoreductase [Planctomycetota bacterium]